MNNLQNDKKEIITLKNQNLERYKTRLNALHLTKSKIEATIKSEENIYNPVGTFGNNNMNFASSQANTTSTNLTIKNKLNSDLEITNSKDNLIKSQCETNKNEGNSLFNGNFLF